MLTSVPRGPRSKPRAAKCGTSAKPLPLINAETIMRKLLGDAEEPYDLFHALRVSVSCAGDIGIVPCTDPQALPDVARLADEIEGSYGELRSAATG